MTPEEAKLILSTCRADKIDTDNPDVRQALELVAASPDLAAWWETEQAFDRAFARKLAGIKAPQALQEAILRGGATIFAARRLITETNTEAVNEELIEKNTPSNLPDPKVVPFHQSAAEIQALAQASKPAAPARGKSWPQLLSWSLAASLLVGLVSVGLFLEPDKATADSSPELPAFTSQFAESASDSGTAEQYSQQMADLQSYLASHQAPQLDALPPELGNETLVGESVGTWKKDTVSIVRMKDSSGNTTLFILNRADFPHDQVGPNKVTQQDGPHTITTWGDAKDIYVLVRTTPTPGS
jgi:hypothetical protein